MMLYLYKSDIVIGILILIYSDVDIWTYIVIYIC